MRAPHESCQATVPTPRRRDWLVNLEATPGFTFHLKNKVTADLPAVATVIADTELRRDILGPIVEDYNARWVPGSPWPHGDLDEWVTDSPLALVTFTDELQMISLVTASIIITCTAASANSSTWRPSASV